MSGHPVDLGDPDDPDRADHLNITLLFKLFPPETLLPASLSRDTGAHLDFGDVSKRLPYSSGMLLLYLCQLRCSKLRVVPKKQH